jgi:hypothetical protein
VSTLKIQEEDYNDLIKRLQKYEKALIEIMLIHNYNGFRAKGIAEKALRGYSNFEQ